MPCHVDYCDDSNKYEELANKATRAACDMRTILRRNDLEKELTSEAREWIAGHDKADEKRIKEETAKGFRELARLAAMAKLNLEDRRVLGL